MAWFHTTLDSPAPPETTFAYLADFARCAAWDPSVTRARRVGRGPIGVGSRFEVVVKAGPIEMPLHYRVTRHDSPHELVLEARSRWLRSLDTIRIEPVARGGCRVHYDADLRLLGPACVFDLATHLLFQVSGRRSAQGLANALQGLAAPRSPGSPRGPGAGPGRRRPARRGGRSASGVRAGAA